MAAIEDGFKPSAQIPYTTDPAEIYVGAGKLRGVYINTTLSAHTVVIKDDTTAMFTIPASSPAGQFIPFGDAEFLTNLTVDWDASMSAGNITLVYNPYPDE